MKLPNDGQRVFITGIYAGIFSQHVCVLPDATDEEILATVNAHEQAKTGEDAYRWTIVVRTLDDLRRARCEENKAYLPGPCQECEGRLHIVIR